MELRRLITIARAWFPLLVASVVLALGAAFVISNALPKSYEAKATLLVGQSLSAANPGYDQLLVSQRLSTTYAALATKRPILDAVISELGLEGSADELAKRVKANAPLDSTLLTLSAQDTDPARAAAIANALAARLLAASTAITGRQAEIQESIDADLKATQDQIGVAQAAADALAALPKRTAAQEAELASLEERVVSLRSTFATLLPFVSGSASNLLTIVEPATVPLDAVSPKPLQNAVIAVLLGLLLAGGVIAVAEILNDRIADPDAVLDSTGLSTLGTIARMQGDTDRSEMYRLAAILYPRSSVAEAYRMLRTQIDFSSVDTPIRTLLVTSSAPGEGKTVTAANLAVVFAQTGRKVLLVDADLRKPGAHLVFDLQNAHGLTTLLRSDDVSLDEVAQTTEQANLRILTTGPLPPNPAELIGSQRMRTIVDRLMAGSDLVIFDSAPLQAVTDAAILSSFLDSTVLVIDARRSKRRLVRGARSALTKAGANVIGAVLNRITSRASSDYSGYYGGYDEADRLAGVPGSGPEPSPSAHARRIG